MEIKNIYFLFTIISKSRTYAINEIVAFDVGFFWIFMPLILTNIVIVQARIILNMADSK